MLPGWVLLLVSLGYAALLFGVAWYGDRRALYTDRPWLRSVVYSLALAVYCSSWTFYGAVGTAVRQGVGYLPIYIGPLLLLLFGWRILERLALIAQSQNTVSIADFIASRYGRSQRLAAMVALIALVAAVPYLALQYKAVAISLGVLGGPDDPVTPFGDPAFYVAALMALFAILFGTRTVDATEHRPGMMLAVALESLVKLVALVAVGVFAVAWLGRNELPLMDATRALVAHAPPSSFAAQCLLAFAAIICLPRQFHVAVVECGDVRDIRRARWLFGGYLVVICLMVLPIASAGVALFGREGPVAPDSFVLALPMADNADLLDPAFAPEAAEEPQILFRADTAEGFDAALGAALARLDPARPFPSVREARGGVALTVALADLAGAWRLEQVTGALTDFADSALQFAIEAAFAEREQEPAGLVALALVRTLAARRWPSPRRSSSCRDRGRRACRPRPSSPVPNWSSRWRTRRPG